MHNKVYDALNIGMKRFSKQAREFYELLQKNGYVSEVLQSIHDNEDWTTVERVFWAFQFGYLIGVGEENCGAVAKDQDVDRGYQ